MACIGCQSMALATTPSKPIKIGDMDLGVLRVWLESLISSGDL